MAPSLTPDEVLRFQALVKSAVVVLLMLRLDRPLGAREMADILGLEEHTTARYLRHLSQINIIARSAQRDGYVLTGGSQLILGSDRTVENLQFEPTTTTAIHTDININPGWVAEVVVDSERTVEKLQFEANPPELSPTGEALREAGIGEPKRSELLSLST